MLSRPPLFRSSTLRRGEAGLDRGASARRLAAVDGFHIVSGRIGQEGGVIVGMVIGTIARRTIVAVAGVTSGGTESVSDDVTYFAQQPSGLRISVATICGRGGRVRKDMSPGSPTGSR